MTSDSLHALCAEEFTFPLHLPVCQWRLILPMQHVLTNSPFPFTFQLVSDSWFSPCNLHWRIHFSLHLPACKWCPIIPMWSVLRNWPFCFTFQRVSDIWFSPCDLCWQIHLTPSPSRKLVMSDFTHTISTDKFTFSLHLPARKWHLILYMQSALTNWPFPFTFQRVSDIAFGVAAGMMNLLTSPSIERTSQL